MFCSGICTDKTNFSQSRSIVCVDRKIIHKHFFCAKSNLNMANLIFDFDFIIHKKQKKYEMSLLKTENLPICKKVGQVVEKIEILKFSNSSGDISISIDYDSRWDNTTVCVFADMFFEHQERITENVLRGEKEIQFNDLILSARGQHPLPDQIKFGVVFERKLFVINFEFKRRALEFYKKQTSSVYIKKQ